MSRAALTQAERAALRARFPAYLVAPRPNRARRARHWLAWRLLDVSEQLVRLASWLARTREGDWV